MKAEQNLAQGSACTDLRMLCMEANKILPSCQLVFSRVG